MLISYSGYTLTLGAKTKVFCVFLYWKPTGVESKLKTMIYTYFLSKNDCDGDI